MSSTNLSFRTPPDLMAKIKARDLKGVENPGATAKRDVARWYSLLSASLPEVTVVPAEAVVMIHAANWWLTTMNASALLGLPDTLRSGIGLDDFYGAYQQSLGESMLSLPLSARAALWDAAERYEVEVSKHPDQTFGAVLHRVGLHTYQLSPQGLEIVESFSAVESSALPAAYMKAVKDARGGEE